MTDEEAAAVLGRPAADRSAWARPVPARTCNPPELVFLQSDAARMLNVAESTITRLLERRPRLASCRAGRRPVLSAADLHAVAWELRRRT